MDAKIKQATDVFQVYFENYTILERGIFPASLTISSVMGRITLGAFACELGIKALILRDGNSFKKEHCLDELFALMNLQTQKDIMTLMEMDSISFNDFIKKNKNLFVEFRYFHEYLPQGNNTFIRDLSNALAYIILGELYIKDLTESYSKIRIERRVKRND